MTQSIYNAAVANTEVLKSGMEANAHAAANPTSVSLGINWGAYGIQMSFTLLLMQVQQWQIQGKLGAISGPAAAQMILSGNQMVNGLLSGQ